MRKRGARKAGEPELMGAKEAAAALGVGQTNLRVTADLPEPYDKVAATTLYRAADIAELAESRGKKRRMDAILEAEAQKRRAADTETVEPAA
jgi:hypothetical protein